MNRLHIVGGQLSMLPHRVEMYPEQIEAIVRIVNGFHDGDLIDAAELVALAKDHDDALVDADDQLEEERDDRRVAERARNDVVTQLDDAFGRIAALQDELSALRLRTGAA